MMTYQHGTIVRDEQPMDDGTAFLARCTDCEKVIKALLTKSMEDYSLAKRSRADLLQEIDSLITRSFSYQPCAEEAHDGEAEAQAQAG